MFKDVISLSKICLSSLLKVSAKSHNGELKPQLVQLEQRRNVLSTAQGQMVEAHHYSLSAQAQDPLLLLVHSGSV